jgi:hypothetical protein
MYGGFSAFGTYSFFILILLLPLIAVNHEIELIIHHTFVDRFCREKVLRQELQPSFDDGLLTCCGFGADFLALRWTPIFSNTLLVVFRISNLHTVKSES